MIDSSFDFLVQAAKLAAVLAVPALLIFVNAKRNYNAKQQYQKYKHLYRRAP